MHSTKALAALLAFVCASSPGQENEIPPPVREADLLAIKAILVEEYPELSASPGYRFTSFFPGRGEPGCESTPERTRSKRTRWAGSSAASPEELRKDINRFLPDCMQPTATVYFAPFRQSGSRSHGAMAQCRSPVTHPDTPPPWEWTCDRVEFRQYVQLEDQDCPVTLVGELSDEALSWFKRAGSAQAAEDPDRPHETLAKVRVSPGGRAWALFGDRGCLIGTGPEPVFFLESDESAGDAAEHHWIVADFEQWRASQGDLDRVRALVGKS